MIVNVPFAAAKLNALRPPGWATAESTAAPLPAAAVEYWDALRGVAESADTITGWVGQIAATNLVAPSGSQRPWLDLDGGYWRGQRVVQCTLAASRFLQRVGGAALLAAGVRPYVAIVARFPTPGAAVSSTSFSAWNSANSSADTLRLTAYSGALYGVGTDDAQAAGAPLSATAAPALTELWFEAGGLYYARDGGTATLVASAVTLPTAALSDSAAVGRQYAGVAAGSDAMIAAVVLCSAKPSAAERAALQAWARAVWGTP